MNNILITGANRGIGLEIVKTYLKKGNTVFACCRNLENTKELDLIHINYKNKIKKIQMDISNEISITKAAQKLKNQRIDVLINNAGTYYDLEKGLSTLSYDKMNEVFKVNTFGPVFVAKHFENNLKLSTNGVLVNIISGTGFIRNINYSSNMQYSYGSSKAALNMFTVYLAADLKKYNITVIGLGPGFVLTDMTKDNNSIPDQTPKDTVPKMIKLIENLDISKTGHFFEYNGFEIDAIVKNY